MSGFSLERRPAGSTVAVVTALAALAALPLATLPAALVVGGLGVPLLALGAFRATESLATFGAGALFAGAALAGVAGTPPPVVLLSVAASVVAWDAAVQAADLAATLGRPAATGRPFAVHVATTAGLVSVASAVGYLAFRASAGGRPLVALVAMLAGALVLATALRT